MRVSSGMIFDAGVAGMNRQTATLLHLQQQVSSGRRILTPSDDPVAAARALEVRQNIDTLTQFKRNQDAATSALALEESQLTGVGDLLAKARELSVQAGSTGLSASQRANIAMELRARFDQLVGIANAADGLGQSMFSGYMGGVTPFGGAVDNLIAGSEIAYAGDDGQRTLQIAPGHEVAISDSGNDVFKNIRSGNGYFDTTYNAANTGGGIVDSGSVTDPAAWNAAVAQNVQIRFTISAGVTTYDLVDTVSGNSLLTGGAAPAPLANQRTYQSGQPIVLRSQGAEPAFDLGAMLTITGAPASGDGFSVSPSSAQSVFVTLAKLIGALEAPVAGPGMDAKYMSEIKSAITNLDQASDNILRVRAAVGARMNEIEATASMSADMSLQYQQDLSLLQDIDYAKTYSELIRKQTDLQAAQQSFLKIAQLSLFNYL